MKAVFFDLDDTLYREMDFVVSGLGVVSDYLAERFGLDREGTLRRMLGILNEQGRGRVFDVVLNDNDIFTEERVRLLLMLYRCHIPRIFPDESAVEVLNSIRSGGIKTGMITDGMASVQRRKIDALGLDACFDVIVCTWELGKEYQKPSPVSYKVAADLLCVDLEDCAYVGNDTRKDFQGPKALGMSSIQIGKYTNGFSDESAETLDGDVKIDELGELISVLERL